MRPKRKKVMITGGAGFIGSYLMDGLAKECYEWYIGEQPEGWCDE